MLLLFTCQRQKPVTLKDVTVSALKADVHLTETAQEVTRSLFIQSTQVSSAPTEELLPITIKSFSGFGMDNICVKLPVIS